MTLILFLFCFKRIRFKDICHKHKSCEVSNQQKAKKHSYLMCFFPVLTHHSLLQTLQILSGLFALLIQEPVHKTKDFFKGQKLEFCQTESVSRYLHEFLQLRVFLLLFRLKFLVVGHESLLLQQQTLIQTERHRKSQDKQSFFFVFPV